jgi:hypothetical protein
MTGETERDGGLDASRAATLPSLSPRQRRMWAAVRALRPRFASCINKRTITTLRRENLVDADRIYLQGKTTVSIPLPDRPERAIIDYVAGPGHRRFPDCGGFLHYVPGPEHAPLAGEIRFRITDNSGIASFEDGIDLTLPGSQTRWRILLPDLLMKLRSKSRPILHLLVADGLVPMYVVGDKVFKKRSRGLPSRHAHDTPIVHSLGQPFHLDLSHQSPFVKFTHGLRMDRLLLHLPWKHTGLSFTGEHRPWVIELLRADDVQGVIECCWEAMQDSRGMACITTRVLRIVKPVRSVDDPSLPSPVEEGQLIRGLDGKPWVSGTREGRLSRTAMKLLLHESIASKHMNYVPPPLHGSPDSARRVYGLAPVNLTDFDVLDLSGLQGTKLIIASPDSQHSPTLPILYSHKMRGISFPLGTMGVLYMHMHSVHSALHELRFRVLPAVDIRTFGHGHDLLGPTGSTWSIPMISLLRSTIGLAFASIFVKEGIASQADCTVWRELKANAASALVCLEQPFWISLEACSRTVWLVHGPDVAMIQLRVPGSFAEGFAVGAPYGTSNFTNEYTAVSHLMEIERALICITKDADTNELPLHLQLLGLSERASGAVGADIEWQPMAHSGKRIPLPASVHHSYQQLCI